jgi:hypothetical protein
LAADLEQRRFLTFSERRDYLKVVAGVSVSNSTVWRVGADGSHWQKGGQKAAEREEFLRATWRVMRAEGKDIREFVFVDECGTHTSLWLPSTGIRLGQSECTRRCRATEVRTRPVREHERRGHGRVTGDRRLNDQDGVRGLPAADLLGAVARARAGYGDE